MNKQERGWLLPPMAVFLALGILLGRVTESLWPFFTGCALTLAAAVLGRNKLRFCAILAVTFCVGCICGSIAYHPALPEEGTCQVTGIVSDEIRTGANGQIKTVLTHVTLDGKPVSSGAYWSFYEEECPEELTPGVQVSMTAEVYHPSGASNPDGYDFREELLRRNVTFGIYGRGDLVFSDAPFTVSGRTAALRNRIAAALMDEMGEEAGGYAATMLLGFRSMISGEDREAFSRLGIAHVLAVSGFHTGVLVAILALLFRLLRLPQKVRLVLYAFFLAFYSLLCGMNQPVIRASVLFLLLLSGKLLNRPRSGLHLLSAAWILMLLFSPVQLTGLSFQLSFGAMLGLTLISPYLQSLHHFRHKVPEKIRQILCAGISAQIGILLPELYAFQELPLLGLLVNIPVSLIATWMILLYWIVAFLLPFPVLCSFPAAVAKESTLFLTGCVKRLGAIPGITLWTHASTWATWIGVILLFLALCGLLRLRTRNRLALLAAGLVITVVSVIPMHHSGTEYIQFAVGNADAAVIWDEDTVICVDTGYDDGVLSSFLHRHRLTPDAVILTHLHSDHAGGILRILEDGIPIPVCYLPEGAEDQLIHESMSEMLDLLAASGAEIRHLARGDVLPLPGGSATVLWPERGRIRPNQDPNKYSLAMLLDLRGVKLLQAGDLDGVLENYAVTGADILKVAHHGSVSSTSPAMVSAVSPAMMLLSCNNVSKHTAFAERYPEIPLYSTAVSGALTLRFSAGSWTVEPYLTTVTNAGGEAGEP